MLLPTAFHPHAACIAKHLPHLRSSQVRGLLKLQTTVMARSGCQNAVLGGLQSLGGLACHAPISAGMAVRRGRPDRVLPGAAGGGDLFRAAPGLEHLHALRPHDPPSGYRTPLASLAQVHRLLVRGGAIPKLLTLLNAVIRDQTPWRRPGT